jgi:hypothetical protein
MIAIGSQNGSVYLFRVSRDGFSYKKWNKIRGSQPLTQLDWSTDGCYLQTVTADYDLVFCEYTCSTSCQTKLSYQRDSSFVAKWAEGHQLGASSLTWHLAGLRVR